MAVVRVNVSVPSHLRSMMLSLESRVNWSAVATKAFEEHIQRVLAEDLRWHDEQERKREQQEIESLQRELGTVLSL